MKLPNVSYECIARCIYLTSNNLCDIYSSRPDICNVEKMYEQYYKYIMSKAEFELLNYIGCKKICKNK